VEEGFCELCSGIWLATLRDARREFLQARLADNPDPTYGGGFRKAQAVFQARALPGVLAWLGEQQASGAGPPLQAPGMPGRPGPPAGTPWFADARPGHPP